MVIELERTFLPKSLPVNLIEFPFKDCFDIYAPSNYEHPHLRIRRLGDKYEITKKQLIEGDASQQIEQTIDLEESEFTALSHINSKQLHKRRYYYPVNNYQAEIDVFLDDLRGLVLVDFEFNSINEKETFIPPDFCLVDITQEEFIAGGYLAGKKYDDIEQFLKMYNYSKLVLK